MGELQASQSIDLQVPVLKNTQEKGHFAGGQFRCIGCAALSLQTGFISNIYQRKGF